MDGAPGVVAGGHYPKSCAASTGQAAAGIRCCNDDASKCKSFCDGGTKLFTYEVAQARCTTEGMRLCKSAEIDTDVCSKTGCYYDLALVWTSDVCDPAAAAVQQNYTIMDGAPGVESDEHHPKSCAASKGLAVAGIRCCSDDASECKSFCDGGIKVFAYEVAQARCVK